MSWQDYHTTRFQFDERREVLWKTLCDAFFSRLVRPDSKVLELGAGHGHFINNILCAERYAVDIWDDFTEYLDEDVRAFVSPATDLSFIENHSIDFVFASNLFEHLTQEEFCTSLREIKLKLRTEGTLNILQPNYRFAYKEYFDDYTHRSVYSDRSLCDFLAANGFSVTEVIPRFLPLTIKSRLPVSPLLIRLYLRLGIKPLAKQMFVRARTDNTSERIRE